MIGGLSIILYSQRLKTITNQYCIYLIE